MLTRFVAATNHLNKLGEATDKRERDKWNRRDEGLERCEVGDALRRERQEDRAELGWLGEQVLDLPTRVRAVMPARVPHPEVFPPLAPRLF